MLLGALEYLYRFYDVLHMAGKKYLMEEIDLLMQEGYHKVNCSFIADI